MFDCGGHLVKRWIATEETVEMLENQKSEGEANRGIDRSVVTVKGMKKVVVIEAGEAGV